MVVLSAGGVRAAAGVSPQALQEHCEVHDSCASHRASLCCRTVTQAMWRPTESDLSALRAGGPVVAYVGRGVPREVRAAAGLTPVRLAGVPGRSALADRYCAAGMDEVARTQLELVLTGQLAH